MMSERESNHSYVAQRVMWEKQHLARSSEFSELAHRPTEFAEICSNYMQSGSRILEVGCANGRDARFFSKNLGANIIALDISLVALTQLQINQADALEGIQLIQAAAPNLPFSKHLKIDAFYARSAIYMDDEQLTNMLMTIKAMLNIGGFIMIQGKTANSEDMQRSKMVGNNLMQDIDGHIRRLWTKQGIEDIFSQVGLRIIELGETIETWHGQKKVFIHVIAQKNE